MQNMLWGSHITVVVIEMQQYVPLLLLLE